MIDYVSETISLLIDRLESCMRHNGSFLSVSDTITRHTTFYTSLVLICLLEADHYDTENILSTSVSFLKNQQSSEGTFNYWERDSPEQKLLPYPDDLDDTFTALTALRAHSPLSETELVSAIQLLVTNEVKPGGPYYTWNTNHIPPWDTVDVVVNAAILLFLNHEGIPLPELQNWIDEHIVSYDFSSEYYRNPLGALYRIAPVCSPSFRPLLLKKLEELPLQNLMDKALFTSSALRLGKSPRDLYPLIEDILRNSHQPISSFPFFVEQETKQGVIWSGCEAFTIAAMIEALALYEKSTGAPDSMLAENIKNIETELLREISARANALVETPLIDRFLSSSAGSAFALLPYRLHQTLQESLRGHVSHERVMQLCVATTFGWVGYTLYDDIVDGDATGSVLPLANRCAREAHVIFGHDRAITDIMHGMDLANQWEMHHCHYNNRNEALSLQVPFPEYGDFSILGQKSFGCALGSLVLLKEATCSDQDILIMGTFFEHFLVARQLNDDAHDWLDDMERGCINPAGAEVLRQFKHLHPHISEISISAEQSVLQEVFWDHAIDVLTSAIHEHIHQARTAVASMNYLTESTVLENLILPLERSANKATLERDQAKKFLEAYQASI